MEVNGADKYTGLETQDIREVVNAIFARKDKNVQDNVNELLSLLKKDSATDNPILPSDQNQTRSKDMFGNSEELEPDEDSFSGLQRAAVSVFKGNKTSSLNSLRRFISTVNVPVEYAEVDVSFQDIKIRMDLLPNDKKIAENFTTHNHASNKTKKNLLRRTLILGAEHRIFLKSHFKYFGKDTYRGTSHIIIEDITSAGKNKTDKISHAMFKGNIKALMPTIGHMPQSNYFIKEHMILGLKKEFEGVKIETGFDYRGMMAVIGACMAQYLSQSKISIETSDTAFLRTNTCPNTLIGRGETVFTDGCGIGENEMNTFCVLMGICGGSVVSIFSDKVGTTNKILSSISLYDYLCRLFRNIMYSAENNGCGSEHLWAFMCGMHKVLKVYSHSDEGGAMRKMLCNPCFPPPQGIIKEAARDPVGFQHNLYESSLLQKRVLLSMLLFFPNAITFSDSGMEGFPVYIPTMLTRKYESDKCLQSYRGFTCAASNVINNMMYILSRVFSLSKTVHKASGMYTEHYPFEDVDKHCSEPIIVPFVWLDPALANVYGLSLPQRSERLSYFEPVSLPMFPPSAEVTSSALNCYAYMPKNTCINISMPQHAMRDYGYSYVLNPRYNMNDGLSEMLIEDNGRIATRSYISRNFLFTQGNPVVGANKWTTPNCSISNYYEFLQLKDRVDITIAICRDEYYPTPAIIMSDTCTTIHTLRGLNPMNTCMSVSKSGNFMSDDLCAALKKTFTRVYSECVDSSLCNIPYICESISAMRLTTDLGEKKKRIGDCIEKANNVQEQTKLSQLNVNAREVKKETSTRTSDRLVLPPPVSKEALDGVKPECDVEHLEKLIEEKIILSECPDTPIMTQEVDVGDLIVPEPTSDLQKRPNVPADTVQKIVEPGLWNISDIGQVETIRKEYISNPCVATEMKDCLASFTAPNNFTLVSTKKIDAGWENYIHDVRVYLRSHGMVDMNICLLGYVGANKHAPDFRVWRGFVCGQTGKKPHVSYPIKIATISRIANKPLHTTICDAKKPTDSKT